jgi:hypothetical protein
VAKSECVFNSAPTSPASHRPDKQDPQSIWQSQIHADEVSVFGFVSGGVYSELWRLQQQCVGEATLADEVEGCVSEIDVVSMSENVWDRKEGVCA